MLQAAPAYVTALNQDLTRPAPTVQRRTWTNLVQNLKIEVLPGPAGSTTTFGVGPDFQCAHTPGGATRPVEFHNATGTYSRGGAIARACPLWRARKCSRSVTFMGRTFTANAGYPACTGETTPLTGGEYTGETPAQQTAVPDSIARTPSNGIFRVRVWGNFCVNGGRGCKSLKDFSRAEIESGVVQESVNRQGYGATFQHASHCGPERWPSEAWRQRNGPGYAEYCDITVDVRF